MSNETVREVLQERLEATLRESIGDLLKEKYDTQSSERMITKLIAELANEAASALGISDDELETPWDNEEDFSDEFSHYGWIFWADGKADQFPLTITAGQSKPDELPFEETVAEILRHFPARSREEITDINIGNKLWMVENGILVDIDLVKLPF